MVSEEELVDRAADAATGYIFSQYARSDVDDLDVRVTFEDETLSVDIVFETNASGETSPAEERQIADDAAIAATAAVDQLMAERDPDEQQ